MGTDRGSIRWHRGGWELRVSVNGRKITRRHRAPNTRAGRRSAEDALDLLLQEVAIDSDGNMTIEDLLELYALTHGPDWSPATHESYRSHVKPVLAAYGHVEVSRLTRADIARVNGSWRADGKAPATVRRRHSLLSAALLYAETELEIIAASPARGAKLPTIERVPPDLPPMGDALTSIGLITHDRLRVVARLAAATGARRGELAALRWCDVDLDGPEPSVMIARALSTDGTAGKVKPTKTGSIRRVTIDPATASMIRSWRPMLAAEAMAAGGPRPGDKTPVVPSPSDPSQMWQPGHVSQRWRTWRRHETVDAVLATMKFHDLRHLHATHLLANGVPVAIVSQRLGHASTQMTFDVYGHVIPSQDQMAADVIAAASVIADAG